MTNSTTGKTTKNSEPDARHVESARVAPAETISPSRPLEPRTKVLKLPTIIHILRPRSIQRIWEGKKEIGLGVQPISTHRYSACQCPIDMPKLLSNINVRMTTG